MIARATLATAARLLAQLRRDPRTVALLLVMPLVLLGLLKLLLAENDLVFQQLGAPLLGLFPLIIMFLVTSVTMLRERTSGTLERLMTLPLRRGDLVLGYALAFAVVAAVQAVLASAFTIVVLGARRQRVDRRARSHRDPQRRARDGLRAGPGDLRDQRVPGRPVPPSLHPAQLLLCGLIFPRDGMSAALQAIARVLPMTYAYDALAAVTRGAGSDAAIDALVTLGFCLLALALGTLTLRRRTA